MKISSFIFDDVSLPPEMQIGRNSHTSWELTYIIHGSGTRSIGNLSEPIAEREIVLIPPGTSHVWSFDVHDTQNGEIANLSIFFESSLLEDLTSIFPEMAESVNRLLSHHEAILFLEEDHDKIEQLLLSMRELTPENRLPKMLELIIVLSNSLRHRCAGTERFQSIKEKKLEKIRVFLRCNYYRRISLDDIVDYMGMNKSSLCTFMRKNTGMTLSEYLNTIRINIASERLLNNDETISSIAYSVGFSDVTYFNRLFRRKYGLSPSQYRMSKKAHNQQ